MPIEILMPELFPDMEEGTLSDWLVSEGDSVALGDVIAEFETDKATVEVEAVDEGIISKLLVAPGTEGVKVNSCIALLIDADEGGSEIHGSDVDGDSQNTPAHIVHLDSSPRANNGAQEQVGPKVKTPLGTLATTEVGIPLGDGSEYLSSLGVTAGTYDLIPLSNIQKVVASRLSTSNQNVPDFPLTIDCELDELLKMRKELNEHLADNARISVNDMLIQASALALKHVPEANASYTPTGIAIHHHADVAVAVAVDGGLITPIVRAAENKDLSTISADIKDLVSRARKRKLRLEEYQGGSFCISNLGMFGIRNFGSIINEPHGMILSVGTGEPRAVVTEGALAVATVMTVTLTCDHRVVDGAIGAKWLQHFKRYVQQPTAMML